MVSWRRVHALNAGATSFPLFCDELDLQESQRGERSFSQFLAG